MSDLKVTIPDALMYSFDSQACQFPRLGPVGLGYFKADNESDPGMFSDGEYIDCLLYRNSKGKLVGILYHYPFDSELEKAGNVNIYIHPRRQRRGIGTLLAREAMKRWGIDFDQQRYSTAGLALAKRLLGEDE